MNDYGDTSGGKAVAKVYVSPQEHGFRGLWLVTWLSTKDNLSTVENVRVELNPGSRGRAGESVSTRVLNAAAGGFSHGLGASLMELYLEPDTVDETMVSFTWATNQNGVTYEATAAGFVWDLEELWRFNISPTRL